ncbi:MULTISPECIES: hydantoinase/oxoprolinase family protein [Agrobacterium]|uniref:Hydantoinase/oxoprolinase family protein n=1 Tax=Agrobacterium rosae TaxID=1972867 RepID=A0AAW9FQP6_9HYPH|nr:MULTISPECIES: hydantoinase/oxoprolinase family protein [Agrobacterium]MDX8321461.1 hydantoinase/oxoprolinase family protein [Agrobacterium sp. rho-8.1]MCW8060818.1 hydantoinase/oxoprolinase family protein [Agrobacterium tumefaciens]MDX8305486.1 hydantoinase/oxoprolinase family protein [Agrobacterium rosae]MDX8311004.1 hydantoinase/oxoprolinase family protein [Agrobacterium sp. rho-13.3]MDX8316861.1 hydantoinase/oxoprolinase family protein [Agrobacterium rosae]
MRRIGIDVGGTFTDFVVQNTADGTVQYYKLPSTPSDPSEAILTGLARIVEDFGFAASDVEYIGHGTTVATNMIIEERGAATGLLTTRGFRDVLAIGRQNRPSLYDTSVPKASPLVERYRRLDVDERVAANGEVIVPLDEEQLRSQAERLARSGVEAVAICFLHSYRNQDHEEKALAVVQSVMPDAYISISSKVLPEFREYERTSTTVLNAYIGPRMDRYLSRLSGGIKEIGIPVEPMTIHSNGGVLSLDSVRRLPVATCLSGPAAGVVGAATVGVRAGMPNLVTFDVGGTSTDVALILNGRALFTSGRLVADHPVKLPMVDIHVIGAGGGSIAGVDDASALKVGPRSAGAAPGPAAYDRGGVVPTLTDANIALNRLDPVALLRGRMPINRELALKAIKENVADPLELTVEEAAYGILQVVTANMSRAIRAVTTERGYDLDDLTLFAYGGAGPLHATEVARECGIKRVLIPQEPGTMCARGALLSDVSLDFVRTCLTVVDTVSWTEVWTLLRELRRDGETWLASEKVPEENRRYNLAVDAHYRGQNFEITVPVSDLDENGLEIFKKTFGAAHEAEYGYDIPGRDIEIVNCRVQAVGVTAKFEPATHRGGTSFEEAKIGQRQVYFGSSGWVDTPVYERSALPVNQSLAGPAVIDEMSSTTIVLPGQQASVDSSGNIIVQA